MIKKNRKKMVMEAKGIQILELSCMNFQTYVIDIFKIFK